MKIHQTKNKNYIDICIVLDKVLYFTSTDAGETTSVVISDEYEFKINTPFEEFFKLMQDA